MLKYDITLWCDYVRGLLDASTHAEMSAHLALPGSESARRTVATFEGLLSFAERDAAVEPPAGALRSVHALGSLLRPSEESSWLKRLYSVLVFDSADAPLAYGVRDMAPAERQLIFRNDSYFVDLRLEQEGPSGSWLVVGQLMEEKDGVSPLANVQVIAASQNRFVGRTRTDEMGEFQADNLPNNEFRLLFLVDDELCLEVPVASALSANG